MKQHTVETLSSYVESLRPIIYIRHFDHHMIDSVIMELTQGADVVEFNQAFGMVNARTKTPMGTENYSLEEFLKLCYADGFERETFLVLKDVHEDLRKPSVIALLQWIAEKNLHSDDYHCTVFIVSSVLVIPPELEHYITVFDAPLPSDVEIREIIHEFIGDLKIPVIPRDQRDEIIGDMAVSFKGLNEFQIKQILTLAYHDGGNITKDDKRLILREKEQFIKKSGMLEIVNFSETIDDIGGLEILKKWLGNKAKVFASLDRAIKFGVDIPKGILILGMPGCGKSLTAKATATLFEIPLVRLDVGRLLGKYIGESEENMRKALSISEAISPCVLWIDEIEKAFAGVNGSGSGNEVTTRLFGQLLTWMQEKKNTVFVVATANDISSIPPEFLRKGRFDEIFFADLPNEAERLSIFDIHLKKRGKWSRDIDVMALARKTKGYSGADIESIVKEAVEQAFIDGRDKLTTDDFIVVIERVKSISAMLKEKIDQMKKITDKYQFIRASEKMGDENE